MIDLIYGRSRSIFASNDYRKVHVFQTSNLQSVRIAAFDFDFLYSL